ncbi:MAG TPA: tRNA (adenosine(37)-N6)-threonylcarbamoyltransferase complex ATPase subunit type 1 TsaE [Vicinamibacterales bacterium]|nr:tRNA (adenosine(37)-N6)-threonylcarbamoyltransferase complex ATPase subunit type 1 TsaE [Vicinamibacterales bacterium]
MSVHLTDSEGATVALGRDLGRRLAAGAVVLLEGPLGAGKTAFARGLAEGLGCDGEDVSSPTFTVVQEYRGDVRFEHVDLYRLTPPEVDDLALDDLLEGGVMAIEWPDRWRHPPAGALRVTLEPVGHDRRRITIHET